MRLPDLRCIARCTRECLKWYDATISKCIKLIFCYVRYVKFIPIHRHKHMKLFINIVVKGIYLFYTVA